jgi:NAD(P)-dependent dehydrogenase (short-subunit alcohol dehydrogenase family)
MARAIAEEPIDHLVHNAGLYGPHGVAIGRGTDESAWIEVLKVNALAPFKLTELLVDNVAASEGRTIAMMSSGMASMAENEEGRAYVYRSSKAALNSIARSLAIDLAPKKIRVVALCPGGVRTDMGGANAPLTAAESVTGLRRVLEGLTMAESGSFIRYDGTRVPW